VLDDGHVDAAVEAIIKRLRRGDQDGKVFVSSIENASNSDGGSRTGV
jgi:nitrogen regulatory protein PII